MLKWIVLLVTGVTALTAGDYADVNGLHLYYESHGSGEPVILLHGGLSSTGMFDEMLPSLGSRRVITVDLQGHGRTADIDRPMSCEAMADDIAGLMKSLGMQKADVLGYSLGGATALRLAIQHPATVRKLVLVSTAFARNGWFPEVLTGMNQMGPAAAEMMKPSPVYKNYVEIAPRPQDFPRLLGKIGDLLRKDYDWSKDIAAIQARTMLIYADNDAIRPAHMIEFYNFLGGGKKDPGWDGSGMSQSRLAILPGVTHYNIFSSPQLAPIVAAFLEGK